MTQAYRGERPHIAILGRCNTGKSTVLNLIAGQAAAIVSPMAGTTGDPLGLGFELLPLGPVTLYDTAGLDEDSELGLLRREAGRKVLSRADLAVLVTDERGIGPWEEELTEALRRQGTPFLLIFNKNDLRPASETDRRWCMEREIPFLCLSADREPDPEPLREALLRLTQTRPAQTRPPQLHQDQTHPDQTQQGQTQQAQTQQAQMRPTLMNEAQNIQTQADQRQTGQRQRGQPRPHPDQAQQDQTHPAQTRPDPAGLSLELGRQRPLVKDILPPGGAVVLVTPIDASAPKGRLIAPQVQVLRELVEGDFPALVVGPDMLASALALLRREPALVITDSQAVREVAALTPPAVPLTTFSIIFARYKADFDLLLAGTRSIDRLPDKARLLVAEACSHNAQHDDIARVKLPNLLRRHTGKELDVEVCAGGDFPDALTKYDLVVHCGGCMLNPGEMRRRLRLCAAAGVMSSNFGMTISLCQGVLERVVAPFDQGKPPQ